MLSGKIEITSLILKEASLVRSIHSLWGNFWVVIFAEGILHSISQEHLLSLAFSDNFRLLDCLQHPSANPLWEFSVTTLYSSVQLNCFEYIQTKTCAGQCFPFWCSSCLSGSGHQAPTHSASGHSFPVGHHVLPPPPLVVRTGCRWPGPGPGTQIWPTMYGISLVTVIGSEMIASSNHNQWNARRLSLSALSNKEDTQDRCWQRSPHRVLRMKPKWPEVRARDEEKPHPSGHVRMPWLGCLGGSSD